MKLTNKYGLPEAFVRAVENDPYDKMGDISVTGLVLPAQIAVLLRRYDEFLEEDASDRVWALLGQACHAMLARSAGKSDISEERFIATLGKDGHGLVISGKSDLLEPDGTLTDWKVTSAWTYIYDSRSLNWEEQLNFYRWLYERHGHVVRRLQIVAIFRDWTKRRFPDIPVAVVSIPVKMWSLEEAETRIIERAKNWLDALVLSDEELPPCSDDDRWAQTTHYAVHRSPKHKRAFRVLESEQEAKEMAMAIAGIVQMRPGRFVRCEEYCPVACVCQQWIREKEAVVA